MAMALYITVSPSLLSPLPKTQTDNIHSNPPSKILHLRLLPLRRHAPNQHLSPPARHPLPPGRRQIPPPNAPLLPILPHGSRPRHRPTPHTRPLRPCTTRAPPQRNAQALRRLEPLRREQAEAASAHMAELQLAAARGLCACGAGGGTCVCQPRCATDP